MVSAGLVHNVSNEAATGQVNRTVLEAVTRRTGGVYLDQDAAGSASGSPGDQRLVSLQPLILKALVLLFLVDLVIRRWEQVLSLASMTGGR